MIKDYQQVIDFLGKERIGVLTTMIHDERPHSAVLHFSFSPDRNVFYFSTDKTSRKATFLGYTHTSNAALVVGFSETEWQTLQLEGVVQIVADEEELAEAKKIHYAMHPNSQKFESDPDTIFLVFKPDWFRYTDFMKKPVEIVLEDEILPGK